MGRASRLEASELEHERLYTGAAKNRGLQQLLLKEASMQVWSISAPSLSHLPAALKMSTQNTAEIRTGPLGTAGRAVILGRAKSK